MSGSSQGFPARYVLELLEVIRQSGGDRAQLIASAGVHELDQPQARLTDRQMEALIEAAEQATGRRDLGFELGRRLRLTSHEVLGYALLTSETFGRALRLVATYSRLMAPALSARFRRYSDHGELTLQPVTAMSPRLLRFYLEAYVVAIHVQAHELLRGPLPPYKIGLSIEAPGHVARYRELAPARISFEALPVPCGTIRFDVALLDRPLPMADANARRTAEERCKSLLYAIGGRGDWSGWCALMLREAEDHQPTLEELAGFLNLSARTLARYLEIEGTSFRTLSLQVRTERARAMLAEDQLSVSQIAYRLGYTDIANFSRSFRKETGFSPIEHRRRHAAA